ncbi:MAG: glycosyltransferase family 2 protein [Desulfobacterales bacterium]
MSYQLPSVSFIITAYNEEKRIKQKIENSLTQDYPKEKLEIIIASDCSSDKTDEIVRSFEDKGIKLVRAPERKGKENAQKHAVDAASGEILVFSDVATILRPNAITNIVKNFSDPTIGCVSSEDKFIDKDGNVSGEGAYVKHEMFLRKLESKVNTLVGLSGSFFAARREICKDWAIDLQSDFNTLLNSIKLGLKGISDPNSIGYYQNIADEKKEFNRKARTVLRGISVLMRNFSLLNPIKYGLFSWQLFSHKLCRWFVPFFLIIAFMAPRCFKWVKLDLLTAKMIVGYAL